MQKGRQNYSAPTRVPNCILDRRIENWVWLGGGLACCDYGEENIITAFSDPDFRLEIIDA